jgi:hypothetical protein
LLGLFFREEMNSSRIETPKKEPEKKKKKNIREIYLQALKHSKGIFSNQINKKIFETIF